MNSCNGFLIQEGKFGSGVIKTGIEESMEEAMKQIPKGAQPVNYSPRWERAFYLSNTEYICITDLNKFREHHIILKKLLERPQ